MELKTQSSFVLKLKFNMFTFLFMYKEGLEGVGKELVD